MGSYIFSKFISLPLIFFTALLAAKWKAPVCVPPSGDHFAHTYPLAWNAICRISQDFLHCLSEIQSILTCVVQFLCLHTTLFFFPRTNYHLTFHYMFVSVVISWFPYKITTPWKEEVSLFCSTCTSRNCQKDIIHSEV